VKYYGEEKPELEDIIQSGVKGMKWGVRKTHDDTPNKRYSPSNRATDRQALGRGAVVRINRQMNAGKSYKDASKHEVRRSLVKAALIVSGGLALKYVLENEGQISYAAVNHINTKRGATAARKVFSDTKGLTVSQMPLGPSTFSKINRQGVYKI
jgi:hypothetical protein